MSFDEIVDRNSTKSSIEISSPSEHSSPPSAHQQCMSLSPSSTHFIQFEHSMSTGIHPGTSTSLFSKPTLFSCVLKTRALLYTSPNSTTCFHEDLGLPYFPHSYWISTFHHQAEFPNK
eukprot:TRINITY_DN2955_c0_g1_i12.p1 TRINITY_DN2955_c0_g1~~TRINITY_DN2955_c0_g1_i12.p1  ORF type:complete len:118 (-),score=1.01 TRINITY_DN2955_c0_g1_i12:14-367(-)